MMRLHPLRIALFACDALLIAASAYLALCLQLATCPLPAAFTELYVATIGPLIAARLTCLLLLRVYRIAVRHIGILDLEVILLGMVLGSVLFTGYNRAFQESSVPASVVVIEWFVSTFAIVGLRIGHRIRMDSQGRQARPKLHLPLRRILILGTGPVAASLAREISRRPTRDLSLVGFLDDAPAMGGTLLYGAPVLGCTCDIRRVITERHVDEVIVTTAADTGSHLREIMERCEDLPIRLRIAGRGAKWDCIDPWQALRDVSVEDLLRREPVHVDMTVIAGYLTGERVLVTGAGGSIGSELVRQITPLGPRQLILLGHGENSIFEIEQELRRELGFAPVCLIADTRDYDRLLALFEEYQPTVVFHAAAHKHVPLMEANVPEAITNNVLGTRNLAQLASLTGVKRFVMISSDKAVNPTNVMGASKRAAELVIQAESRQSETEFAIVRFGNVLGSRGSVVPLMLKQIQHGGPVTVTHPEITRYFMTIPEAVQLVIHAGSLGGRGSIYILDMGAPVRIIDLSRDLIRLAGRIPGKDIAIEITGLRPGEKLHEELMTAREGTAATRHSRIFVAPPDDLSVSAVDRTVDQLIAASRANDSLEIRRLLKVLEPKFSGYRTPQRGDSDADALCPSFELESSRGMTQREDLPIATPHRDAVPSPISP
jgi:FlaA1/EpsC-like NDP-sugar epimerase